MSTPKDILKSEFEGADGSFLTIDLGERMTDDKISVPTPTAGAGGSVFCVPGGKLTNRCAAN
jgi:hypothetical protein